MEFCFIKKKKQYKLIFKTIYLSFCVNTHHVQAYLWKRKKNELEESTIWVILPYQMCPYQGIRQIVLTLTIMLQRMHFIIRLISLFKTKYSLIDFWKSNNSIQRCSIPNILLQFSPAKAWSMFQGRYKECCHCTILVRVYQEE